MKIDNKYYLALALIPMLTGCADYFDTNNYAVEKPEDMVQYEYLNAYKPLKEYIDRASHPGFLLGTGVSAPEYLKGENVYLLTNSNFDQVTAGNAMKYASVVADDGTMNFGTVHDFVSAATEAGMQVYGHTLCWHEQQNVKWLNSLIADKEIAFDPNERLEVEDAVADFSKGAQWGWGQFGNSTGPVINSDGCFELTQDTPTANFWELQYQIVPEVALVAGQEYILKVMVKGTSEGVIQGKVGDWGGGPGIRLSFNEDWEEKTFKFTPTVDGNNFVLFQHGDFVGTVQIRYVKVVHEEAPSVAIPVPVWEPDFASIENKDDAIMGWGNNSTRKVVDNVLELTNPSKVNPWEAQAGKDFDTPMEVGTKYYIKLKVKGSKEGSISAGFQNPNGYIGCGDFNRISFTTDWQEVTVAATCNGDNAVRFLFSYGDFDGTVYIESMCLYYEELGNKIPLTPEEKAEALTVEMERWVKGMMEATEGKVKAWDVVNEPISGGPWGQRYDLQHAATSEDPSNKFYWQDYLGDDYVRVPVKFARQYFEENGGNPSDLKLFINDYNLESDWDDNQKLRSLISWIEQWESDGVTKIDGIGTQMHINYYLNPQTQKSKEDHIVKMFELMAATGKLVRITELDMGLCDESGNAVKTEDVTFEQHKLMAEHYKWIIRKYFEIIPQAQQYGICQWAQTDSQEGSGWRAGEPIGLWNLNYNRKPAYGGFADGLQGN